MTARRNRLRRAPARRAGPPCAAGRCAGPRRPRGGRVCDDLDAEQGPGGRAGAGLRPRGGAVHARAQAEARQHRRQDVARAGEAPGVAVPLQPAGAPAATGKLEEALRRVPDRRRDEPGEQRGGQGTARRPATSCARRWRWPGEGKTALETLIERTRDVPAPGLDLPPGSSCRPRSSSATPAAATSTRRSRASPTSTAVRPRLPRRADHDRSPQRHLPGRGEGVVRHDADLLPGHRAAHHHHHPGHAGEAPRVRGGGRSDVLPEQRRPRRRRSTCCGSSSTSAASRRSPAPTRSRSGTRPSGCRPPAGSSRPSTRPAPRWSSTSNCSR